ncbi:hypothetical protein [Paraburkholderia sp. RL17-381-BIF-C]|uniref:hypothetical protein n=1 Tax=Paraburkholderia sp. RL17-381-BIF-C TaxID=3031635 RepID=UPI0038BD9C0B
MKAIQKLLDRIEVQRKSIDRLQSDRSAAQVAIDGAGDHVAAVTELKGQRRRLLAEAMIAKKPPNTTAIDAQISNAEQLDSAARAAAATAHDALDIIEEGIRIAEAELDNLRDQLRAAVGGEILASHDAALEKYVAAVAALEDCVAGMVAAERAWERVAHVRHGQFPGRGAKVLEDLRETGLRVPYTASRLADPKVAAEYTDDYPNHWYLPAWADPRTTGFADDRCAQLIDNLIAAGVDCEPLRKPQPPEPQIMVRIIRGEIHGAPSVQRSPATGEVISQTPVVFRVGDDVALDESVARRMKASRLVLIHGEDEMPDPKAPTTGPVVIDASVPKEPEARQRNVSMVGDYRGTFHSLDMTGYEG